MVRPFGGSETVTSLALPVREPSGSPLVRESAEGTGMAVRSESAMGFENGTESPDAAPEAGAVAGVCARQQVCARQLPASKRTKRSGREMRRAAVIILRWPQP